MWIRLRNALSPSESRASVYCVWGCFRNSVFQWVSKIRSIWSISSLNNARNFGPVEIGVDAIGVRCTWALGTKSGPHDSHVRAEP